MVVVGYMTCFFLLLCTIEVRVVCGSVRVQLVFVVLGVCEEIVMSYKDIRFE